MLFPLQGLIFNQADEHPNHKVPQKPAPTLNSLDLLRQELPYLLRNGYPPADRVAESAGMSIRSFQRRLANDQLSYSLLVDQARFETAICLLQDPNLKLIEIALELGYNDAANFTRAFKRWTGMPPSQFRHLHVHP